MLSAIRNLLHRRMYPQRYRYLKQLLRTQQLCAKTLRARQQRELQDIIEFARSNTEFYRHKYHDLGNNISDLPLLTKDEVISQREQMLSRLCDKSTLRIGATGGSTGKPVSFYYDDDKMQLMRAGMIRSYQWCGWQPGEKILNFWGARQDIKSSGRLARKFREFVAAEKTIAAYEYRQTDLADWVACIQSYRPVIIQGYASILAELADHILQQKLSIPASLKGVYTTAEVLYDQQRKQIEQAFNCKVYNQYGCREIPNIAVECRRGNMHVLTDMVYLESLPLDDEERFVITSLTNRVMPMIRYDVGDAGRLKPGSCECGSPFPMLEMGLCRSNDIIRTVAGKHIYPSFFIHLLDDIVGIRQFRFRQTAIDSIVLEIESDADMEDNRLQSMRDSIRQHVHADMQLTVQRLDSIERTTSGKHRFVMRDFAD